MNHIKIKEHKNKFELKIQKGVFQHHHYESVDYSFFSPVTMDVTMDVFYFIQ